MGAVADAVELSTGGPPTFLVLEPKEF